MWNDDKAAALSLTFDDGLASHVDIAAPLMHERGLLATFFIVIGHVGIPYGAEWAEWQTVVDMGHEIASHTINHLDLTTISSEELWREIVLSKTYFEQNITNARIQTFCYPGGAYNQNVIDLIEDHYIGARGVPDGLQVPESHSPGNPYTVIPVPFGTNERISDMNQLVEDAVETGGWLVEMIHGIENDGYEPVPLTNFVAHLDYLVTRQDDVWVAPFGRVIKYIQERDMVTPIVTQVSDLNFSILLESVLNAEIFDEPLTVKISVPADWIDVNVVVGGDNFIVHTDEDDEHRSFLFDMGLNSPVYFTKSKPAFPSAILIAVLLPTSSLLAISLRGYLTRLIRRIRVKTHSNRTSATN
jgi:peptidoglycan/xylan/chitin deacetylase (PgdA/CDA1 family)